MNTKILKKTIIIGALTLFTILIYACTPEDIEKEPVQKLPTVIEQETENVNARELDSGDKDSAEGLPKR